jgi:hypothetical protein
VKVCIFCSEAPLHAASVDCQRGRKREAATVTLPVNACAIDPPPPEKNLSFWYTCMRRSAIHALIYEAIELMQFTTNQTWCSNMGEGARRS